MCSTGLWPCCASSLHHYRLQLVLLRGSGSAERLQPSSPGLQPAGLRNGVPRAGGGVPAYATTILLTLGGTVLGLLLQTMTAYVLARKTFTWRRAFSFFFYFTTLFSGGLVPYYLLITTTLGLRDNYLALLLP